jgi:hypothetical protein
MMPAHAKFLARELLQFSRGQKISNASKFPVERGCGCDNFANGGGLITRPADFAACPQDSRGSPPPAGNDRSRPAAAGDY